MAWLDSASIDCAREMRGIASIANAVAPVFAIAWLPAPLVSGARKPTRTESDLSDPDLALLRRRDLGDHVGVPGAVAERRAGLLEQLVRDSRLRAGAGLEQHLVALLGELAHDVGHERDAALALGGLLGDSDLHERGKLYERATIWRHTRP